MNQTWPEIRNWRRQRRAELIAQRVALDDIRRRGMNVAISAHIEAGFALLAGMTVGFCWPHQGEFDARFALRHFRGRGATAALPVVIAKAAPLQFRAWWPGAPMMSGAYDIPIPDATALVVPDAAIVPLNGFDARGYRLGYGGGYFDRTLAAMSPPPLAIGVGYESARLATIYPQPHDIAMDFVVTEAGLYAVTGSNLASIGAGECGELARHLCEKRGLPRRRAEVAGGYSSPPCYAGEFPGYCGETGHAK